MVRVIAAAIAAGVLAAVARAVARRRPGRAALGAGVIVLLVVGVAAGREIQTDFDSSRYRAGPVQSWLQAVPDSAQRVALAGRLGGNLRYGVPIAAFGPRMRNEVEFLGSSQDHLLVEHRHRGDFLQGLQRGHFDLLVVGRPPDPGTDPLGWARSSGWRPVVEDDRFTLLESPARRGLRSVSE